MPILYRKATHGDAVQAAEVYAAAVNDLSLRHGYGERRVPVDDTVTFCRFMIQTEPEGFWVAEDDRRIVGMGSAWRRAGLWFLAFLFVAPDCQARGIGRGLIDHMLPLSGETTITNRALITNAYNRSSTGLYLSRGLYPREPLYILAGKAVDVRNAMKAASVSEPLVPATSAEELASLQSLDKSVLGVERELHHRFLRDELGAECLLLRKEGTIEGYAYVWPDGQVGPLAAASSKSFVPLLNGAVALAGESGADQVSMLIAGSNETAIQLALQIGMRITVPMVLLSERGFGDWSRYVFHSPWLA